MDLLKLFLALLIFLLTSPLSADTFTSKDFGVILCERCVSEGDAHKKATSAGVGRYVVVNPESAKAIYVIVNIKNGALITTTGQLPEGVSEDIEKYKAIKKMLNEKAKSFNNSSSNQI